MSPGPLGPDPRRALLPICSRLGPLPGLVPHLHSQGSRRRPPGSSLGPAAPEQGNVPPRSTSPQYLAKLWGLHYAERRTSEAGFPSPPRSRASWSWRPGLKKVPSASEPQRAGAGDRARPRLKPNNRPRAECGPRANPAAARSLQSGGGSCRLRAPSPGPGRGLGPLSQWAPRSSPLPRPGRSRRGASAGEIVSDVPRLGPGCPGPAGPRGGRGAPGRKPDAQCGRQLRTRRPCARHIPSPSAPAPPASAERGAPGRRRGRLREARRPPRAHSAAGRPGRLGPAEGRRGPRLCSGRGGPAGARLTLLLGSMAALRRRLWQRRVRGR